MRFAERDRLHLLFVEDASMIFFRRRNASDDYILATFGLHITVLRSIGGRKLTVAHAYSLWFEEEKTNWEAPICLDATHFLIRRRAALPQLLALTEYR